MLKLSVEVNIQPVVNITASFKEKREFNSLREADINPALIPLPTTASSTVLEPNIARMGIIAFPNPAMKIASIVFVLS